MKRNSFCFNFLVSTQILVVVANSNSPALSPPLVGAGGPFDRPIKRHHLIRINYTNLFIFTQ